MSEYRRASNGVEYCMANPYHEETHLASTLNNEEGIPVFFAAELFWDVKEFVRQGFIEKQEVTSAIIGSEMYEVIKDFGVIDAGGNYFYMRLEVGGQIEHVERRPGQKFDRDWIRLASTDGKDMVFPV